jgi:hypothetical protein
MARFDVHYQFVTKLTVSVDVPENEHDDEFSLRRKATELSDEILNGVSLETMGFMITDPNLTTVDNYVERSEQ